MKPAFTCDLDRSIEFLNDALAESDEAIFVEHLNDCDSCRQRVKELAAEDKTWDDVCLLYTSPSPRDQRGSRMPSSA